MCDELSSIIEDMTNETNKHPRDNQTAFRWFSEHCKVWVGLDAHLMDTSLVLATEYFKDVQVHVNHHRGERKNAVFIPIPKWRTLDKSRVKACMPNAPARHVDDFSDATCMYDLMFDCWSKEIPTFLVCMSNWETGLRKTIFAVASLGLLCYVLASTTTWPHSSPTSRVKRGRTWSKCCDTRGLKRVTVALAPISER